jgi:hypothetical protein
LIGRSLFEPAPGLGSPRRAAALQQIAHAKRSQDPSEVLELLRAAAKFFSGSRPQLSQQIANLEAEEAQFRQRLFKAEANASKSAPELEPEREPELPEPQPEPEAEPQPEPATRSAEAQGQTDALMNSRAEQKPKKRKQKQRKQNALVMPTPEPPQSDTPTVPPSEPEPEPELPPALAELPEFRLLAEMLSRLALLQHLPLCVEHEFDMDTLMVCDAADLVDIGLPSHAVDVIAAEIKTLRGVRTNAVDEADHQGPQDPVEEAATTYSAAQIAEWDDDTAAAWLQTLDLGGEAELAAMLSVELDGDDLAKATDMLLEAHCKKVADRAGPSPVKSFSPR